MKKFVVISDLHAHPWSAFSTGDGFHNSRLQRSFHVLDASLQHAHDVGIPWVFAGDLVHTAGYALNTVMAGLVQILSGYPEVDKLMIWGNHDARGKGGQIDITQTCLAGLAKRIQRLYVLDADQRVIATRGITFSGSGYQPLFDAKDYAPESDVGIYHQTIRGSSTPSGHVFEEGIETDELLKRHRMSIVGHIHHPQQLPAPEGQAILVPGSPEQQNFGDKGEHGWWVVHLVEGMGKPKSIHNPEVEFVPGGSPEFRTVDLISEVRQDDGHYYRVRNVGQGDLVPDNTKVIAPRPTIVKSRGIIDNTTCVDDIIETWLAHKPPTTVDADRSKYYDTGRNLLAAQAPHQLRDVTVQRITLRNFCCFERQELEVQEGLWLITGTGKDFPSNGAGKSTLIGEALYWLLSGRTTKGLGADEVIRWGSDECSVSAVLYDHTANSNIIVTRYRGPEGHTLHVTEDSDDWQAASVNEMTKKLQEFLGITPEIFQNLSYFSQEKLMLFSSATDGERKNVLADLIGLRAYQEAAAAANSLADSEGEKAVRNETRASTLADQLIEQDDIISTHTQRVEDWEADHAEFVHDANARADKLLLQKDAAGLKEQRQQARIDASVRILVDQYRVRCEAQRAMLEADIRADLERSQQSDIAVVESQLGKQADKVLAWGFQTIPAARSAVDGLPQLAKQMDEARSKFDSWTALHSDHKAALQLANSEKGNLNERIGALRDEMNGITISLRDGVCPTCGQSVSNDRKDEFLKPLMDKRAELNGKMELVTQNQTAKLEEVETAERERDAARQAWQQLTTLTLKLQNTQEDLHRLDVVERELDEIRNRNAPDAVVQELVDKRIEHEVMLFTTKQRERASRVAHAISARAAQRTREYKAAREAIDDLAARVNPHIGIREDAIKYRGQIEESWHNYKSTANDARQRETIYDYWAAGFSKQGIQSLLMEQIADIFNANRSAVFPLLTQGVYDVQFSTISTTRKGELRERTDFFVYEHGKQVPYGTLSGGQRRRVDIGIMLILTQAVAQWMGTRGVFGMMILDEVFGFLDSSGAEGLLAALHQVNMQVPTIYVMTHEAGLQSMIPDAIHVRQNSEGVSEVD